MSSGVTPLKCGNSSKVLALFSSDRLINLPYQNLRKISNHTLFVVAIRVCGAFRRK
ncbi:MAG: hypothetical protein AAGJ08_21925 [Cyanobacteria bacterium P01_H01_bin.35]